MFILSFGSLESIDQIGRVSKYVCGKSSHMKYI